MNITAHREATIEAHPTLPVITITREFDATPDRETLTFEDIGEDRTRLTTTSVVDSIEARDAILSSGMEVGVHEGYQKLDALLAPR